MVATQAEVARTYGAAVADLLDETARWRESKAAQFPDDPRNTRSATALRAAAAYVRELEDPLDNAGLRYFAGLAEEYESWGRPLEPHEGFGDQPTAARFFFDNGSREPTAHDFDLLVLSVFRDALEALREGLEDGSGTPPVPLVRFFEEHDVPLWQHDEEEIDNG